MTNRGSTPKGVTDLLKRKKLRHNEYYNMQHRFDNLYAQSVDGQNFYDIELSELD